MATSPSLTHDGHPLKSILIIGAGVFGLSTTLSLLTTRRHAHTKITLLDPYLPTLDSPSSPTQPTLSQNPHASSIDSSRIIRPDYALPPYAKLASQAQDRWRTGYGGHGVYRESGIIMTAEKDGSEYVRRAMRNTQGLGYRVEGLGSREDIRRLLGTGGEGGESGYVNWGSGWADAGTAMDGCMRMVVEAARERNAEGRGEVVVFKRGKARRLMFRDDGDDDAKGKKRRKVVGAVLEDGSEVLAGLTIVAAGAWSGALVDLRGRAEARGQVLAYVRLTDEEKQRLENMPVVLNLSTGMFAIPPIEDTSTIPSPAPQEEGKSGNWVLKVARHAFGYANPTTTVAPAGGQEEEEEEEDNIVISLPAALTSPIPAEGDQACRAFLRETIPWLGDRPFTRTRICWYADTPTGDFLIDYHPSYAGRSLFLATGGSGHGFKFLPVLGDEVVKALEGRLEGELRWLWRWRVGERRDRVVPFRGCEDGSRRGRRGMLLEVEWAVGKGVGEGEKRMGVGVGEGRSRSKL